MRTLLPVLAAASIVAGAAAPAVAAPEAPAFRIAIPPLTEGGPFTGWLTVYLMRTDTDLPKALRPSDGPFPDDPQPMFSMYVENAQPGETIEFVADKWFPAPPDDLAPGSYRVQAVLDRAMYHTSWKHEIENVYTPIRVFTQGEDEAAYVQLPILNNVPRPDPTVRGVEKLFVRSDLMSRFTGQPWDVQIGVVTPVAYDPEKEYPAVYIIPAYAITPEFGGDYREAFIWGAQRINTPDEVSPLWDDAFIFVLDPQGIYGHHFWTNSPNNGPVEDMLVREILPALESQYSLIRNPDARVLMGHGSGGWAAIWLAMHHPDVFSGAWASSPDPVDFRALQTVNIYEADNIYSAGGDDDSPSYRKDGEVRMTIREANIMEDVMGPNLTSGKQWAAWQAAFGPGDGQLVRPLFDVNTGEIDPAVAEQWKQRDISALLRADQATYGPIFRDRVRISVGDNDNWYFNNAVNLLKQQVDALGLSGGEGYIRTVNGMDHAEAKSRLAPVMLEEIREHFQRKGVLPE